MNNYSHPYIQINYRLKEYYHACNQQDFTMAYEIAEDIVELSEQLAEMARNLANDE